MSRFVVAVLGSVVVGTSLLNFSSGQAPAVGVGAPPAGKTDKRGEEPSNGDLSWLGLCLSSDSSFLALSRVPYGSAIFVLV